MESRERIKVAGRMLGLALTWDKPAVFHMQDCQVTPEDLGECAKPKSCTCNPLSVKGNDPRSALQILEAVERMNIVH